MGQPMSTEQRIASENNTRIILQKLEEIKNSIREMTEELRQSRRSNMSFPFLKLPPELRNEVYHYHLVMPDKVKVTLSADTSFVRTHLARCPLNEHSVHRRIRCRDIFSRVETNIEIPPSSLSLLLVNSQINEEARPIFYNQNDFIFAHTGDLLNFLKAIGEERRKYLCNLTFAFGWGAHQAFKLLAQSNHLTELHISLDIDMRHLGLHERPAKSLLSSATGIQALSKLRGLKVVELAGFDKTSRGEIVNINHPDAVGPWLKNLMMQPDKEKRPRRSGVWNSK